MVTVELTFNNTSSAVMNNVDIGVVPLQSGMKIQSNSGQIQIGPGGTMTTTIGIDFNDTLQPASFNIWWVKVFLIDIDWIDLVSDLIRSMELKLVRWLVKYYRLVLYLKLDSKLYKVFLLYCPKLCFNYDITLNSNSTVLYTHLFLSLSPFLSS
jgi:hypothetical protein